MDGTTPPLSVLLPCRDAEEHLPQAIRSLELQTFSDFEVVAVDDGSRDRTGSVLDRWAARDPRVSVLHLERVGLAQALRTGAARCRGSLLARFDADDVAHPRRLQEQVAFLNAHSDISAVGTGVRYFPLERVGRGARRYERWINDLDQPRRLARDIFVECPIAHPTLTTRRAAFEEAGGYRSNGWPEDYDLVLRLHTIGARLANIPKILHFWREREGRLSRTDPRYSRDAFRRCKIAYLKKTVIDDNQAIDIWGAGSVGKAFARALLDARIRVHTFFDIDPRKIGQQIHGAIVRDARKVERHLGNYLLVAVGAAGARELIRDQLGAIGLREPDDFRCVA